MLYSLLDFTEIDEFLEICFGRYLGYALRFIAYPIGFIVIVVAVIFGQIPIEEYDESVWEKYTGGKNGSS